MKNQQLDLAITPDDWKWEILNEKLGLDNHRETIRSAYVFALEAHKNQKRDSGHPYMVHPCWIAGVVAQLNLGDEAVCAALLHDCVEDTGVTLEEISDKFGDEVALLVAGLTDIKDKSTKAVLKEDNIEVYKKFLFSSVNDVRVLVIRLVDKLHNGLTLQHVSQVKRNNYGRKVLAVYAPVAEYVGLHYFKRMLEDLAFEAIYPQESAKTRSMLVERQQQEEKALESIKHSIELTLHANHITEYEIQSRIKGLYSTYRKILKSSSSDKLKDRAGIRILVNSVETCYTVLGLLHAWHQNIPEEFDDYISNPKPNGYRSIHTVLSWNGLGVEVQIRTFEMHDFNEFGPASHIAYKLNSKKTDSLGYEWVKDLVAWERDKDKNLKNYKIKVLQDYIYVFTPKNDVIQLPMGATALDFAYSIHKVVGDRCIGVKVNNKMAKISDTLNNGDRIVVIVGSKDNVNRDWLGIVKTRHALDQVKKSLSTNLGP